MNYVKVHFCPAGERKGEDTKKRVVSVFALVLALSLTACGDQPTQPQADLESPGPAYDLSPLFGSDSKIAFTGVSDEENWASNIFVINADGTGSTNITPDCSECDGASWSPDGTKIAFERWLGREEIDIYLMNADGTGQEQLTYAPGRQWAPVWSPTGDKIMFKGPDAGGTSDIWVMNPDGLDPVNLTNTPEVSEEYPTWSPDGTQIAFRTSGPMDFSLSIMDSDGTLSSARVLLAGGYGTGVLNLDQYNFDWSPDGSQIVIGGINCIVDEYHCHAWGPPQDFWVGIFKVDVNTADWIEVTGGYGGEDSYTEPSWSPDGTQITFDWHSRDLRHWDIIVIDDDGSNWTNITSATPYDEVWAPDWGLVPAAPPPPDEMVDLIAGAVDELVAQGILNQGEANGLTVKLDAVKRRIDEGKLVSAVNLLGAFINQVGALANSGRLSANDAQVLIDAAQNAIDQLNG